jgi:hypothetical protein
MRDVAPVPGAQDLRTQRWRRLGHWLTLAITVLALLFFGLKAKSMWISAGETLAKISWLSLIALPLFCLWTLAASLAWRALIADAGVRRIPSVARLWLIRVQAQAVNLVLPLAGLGGEALRATVLGYRTRQGTASVASVASDVLAEIIACFVATTGGALVGWNSVPGGPGVHVAFALGPVAAVLGLYFVPPHLVRMGKRVGSGRIMRRLRSVCTDMDKSRGSGWWSALSWHLVERLLITAETWIYAHALGFRLSIVGAFVATAMMTLLGALMFFLPAQVGAADGGLALGLQWLGAPWSMGFAVAFARRIRQVLVALIGLGLLAATGLWQRKVDRQKGHSVPADTNAQG